MPCRPRRYVGLGSTRRHACALAALGAVSMALTPASASLGPQHPALCAALAHAKLPAPLAGTLACPEDVAARLEPAALALVERRTAANDATAADLRAGAAVRLVWRDLERARALLERAAARSPDDAATLNDLAVLHLHAFETNGDLVDLLRALESAARATRAAPSLTEADITRALVDERLGLAHLARSAWERLAPTLPAGHWRQQAAARVASLATPGLFERWRPETARLDAAARWGDLASLDAIARGYPHGARRWGEAHALPAWAAAVQAHDEAGAAAQLSALERVGWIVASTLDDDLLAEVAAAVRRPTDARDTPALSTLAEGTRLYAEAIGAQGADQQAAALFARSAALLHAHGSPLALLADFWRACALESDGQLDAASAVLGELEAPLATRRAPHLVALRDSELGALASRRGQHYQALQLTRRAVSAFERARDLGNLALLHARLHEVLHTLGEVEAAGRELHAGLALLPDLGLWPRRVDLLAAATRFALAADQRVAAGVFDDELLAATGDDPVAHADGLLLRASLAARGVTLDEAGRHLRAARQAIDTLPQANSLRARLLGEWHSAAAEIHAGRRGTEAERFVQGAFDYFGQVGQRGRLARLHTLRARVALANGRRSEARESLEQALRYLEQSGDEVESTLLQAAWSGQAREAYDALASLHVDAGQAGAALEVVERGRARGLLRAAERHNVHPLNEHELVAALPAGVELVAYAVLPERVWAWQVTNRGVRHVWVARDAGAHEALRARVEQVARALEHHQDSPELLADLGRLHAALLAPVLRTGANARRTLVIVPDGFLHRVPFAALRDARGTFVVQDRAVVMAPSASLYLLRHAADCQRPATIWRAAVAGQAEVDARAFPDLERLTRAEVEAREVAALYRDSALLLGPQATRATLLAAAREADVLHIAAHARASSQRPADSALLLASSDGDPGLLTLRDLESAGLPRTRVAVLSACSTARGPISRGEGVLGLARAFQAASVTAVVASAWDVEDASARALMVSFHAGLARGLSAAQALRQAQIQAAMSADARRAAPGNWAAFATYGDTCGVRAAVTPR